MTTPFCLIKQSAKRYGDVIKRMLDIPVSIIDQFNEGARERGSGAFSSILISHYNETDWLHKQFIASYDLHVPNDTVKKTFSV